MNTAILSLVNTLFDIFTLLILIEVIGSWIMVLRVKLPDFVYRLLEGVQSITSVVLNPIRRIIPNIGGLDISPIVALILLDMLRRLMFSALLR